MPGAQIKVIKSSHPINLLNGTPHRCPRDVELTQAAVSGCRPGQGTLDTADQPTWVIAALLMFKGQLENWLA